MKHTLTCRIKDKPGVLSIIANSFRDEGINIQSVAVSITEGYEEARMTIVIPDDERERDIEELAEHLMAMDEVIEVEDLAGEDFIQRELVLIKVEAAPENIPRITQLLELFDAPVVDIGKETLTVEFSGPTNKVEALIRLLEEFNIRAVTRTGVVALKTGDEV
ncbi:acetolactate synthase small subunit [Planctomycetota bacterium]